MAGIIVCEPSGSDRCDPGTWLCVIDLWSSAFTPGWEQVRGGEGSVGVVQLQF